ncbi:MAG: TrbC/VIRB2 family protein [Sphingosinicella sp.]|nr:TrbC/VIRB2 family protein [Sphingosinicella sp.]
MPNRTEAVISNCTIRIRAIALACLVTASGARATIPDADAATSGAIPGAVQWLQSTLLGTVAISVAVMAVAAYGLLMMSGRIDWRRGAAIILGCFILFGAPFLASGIVGATDLAQASGMEPLPPDSIAVSPPPPSERNLGRPQSVCWTCGIAPPEPTAK